MMWIILAVVVLVILVLAYYYYFASGNGWTRLVNRNSGKAVIGSASGQLVLTDTLCPPGTTDPKCLWKVINDQLVQKTDPQVPVAAYGGGNLVKLASCFGTDLGYANCHVKPDIDGRLITTGANGASAGGDLVNVNIGMNKDCTMGTTNPLCLWSFQA
jgi:hypothetical protein